MTVLDLEKLPVIENVHGLLKYDPFREFPSLRYIEDISERVYGCAEFIGSKHDTDYPYLRESAFLRAFLNEFVSLSEVLRTHRRTEFNSLAIDSLDLPLPHVFKLLRNVNTHVRSHVSGTTTYQARLMNKSTGEVHGESMEVTRYIIADLDLDLLRESRDLRHYDEQQIEAVLNWMNDAQDHHGISDVLEEGLRQYCALIADIATDSPTRAGYPSD